MKPFAWLEDASSPATVLAYNGSQQHTRQDFCVAVAAAQTSLQHSTVPEWIVWEADTWRFAIALFALLTTGKRVILPPNDAPATLAALQQAGAHLFVLAAPATVMAAATGLTPGTLDTTRLDGAEVVLYTSGSTGEAKRIARPFSRLLAEVRVLESCFGSRPGNSGPVVASVSHQHIYGLLFKLLWPWAYGRAFVNAQAVYPEHLVQLAGQHDNAVLVSSPALLKRWPDDIALPCLYRVFSSGGHLPDAARQRFHRQHGLAITEILGASETGGIAWRGEKDEWQALPGVELRCAAATGALSVRSPHTAEAGWVETGDAVTLTDHGLRWLGRLDRLIKLEEKRISLDAIEQTLRAQAGVQEAHVLVLPGQRLRLAAVIVPDAQGQEKLRTLGQRQWFLHLHTILAQAVDQLALPRRWRLLPALPVNAQGKTDSLFLQALFSAVPTLPEVLDWERRENTLVLTLKIPASLHYFQGHFPVAPVLPGVVQLAWAEQFGRLFLGVRGHFQGMEHVKFQHIVHPDTTLTLTLDYQTERQRLLFSLRENDKNFASGRLVYSEAARTKPAQITPAITESA